MEVEKPRFVEVIPMIFTSTSGDESLTATNILGLAQGSCDCHTHVFPNASRYPFYENRIYTPPLATLGALRLRHEETGIDRVVVVQPSVYGLDNRATLDAVAEVGQGAARAVVVIGDKTTDEELERMAKLGACGIRVNIEIDGVAGMTDAIERLKASARRVKPLGWHVQILANYKLLGACSDAIAVLGVPVVLDHYAGAHSSADLESAEMDEILQLVKSGAVYVKLSAPYRLSDQSGFWDLKSMTRHFSSCNSERMLWGSDWPHPDPRTSTSPMEVGTTRDVDFTSVLSNVRSWIGDDAVFQKMMVANPERLYGF